MMNNIFPKIEITFAPTWWYHNYGMDFGHAEMWQDPQRYIERDRQQRRLLYERFGDVGLGELDPQPHPCVGGEFGHRFMSAFWGCEVAYLPDQWPHTLAYTNAYSHMLNLEVPDVHTSSCVQILFKNARLLEERYGFCQAEINFGGPLNNAVSILGEEIFMACAAEPELAQHVLRKMGEACLAVYDQVQCHINRLTGPQTRRRSWSLGNCPVGQISSSMYRSVVLPVDQWLCHQFQQPPLLHHCGLFHPYREAYQALSPQELDVGPSTDLSATRAAYPFTPVSAYIEVGSLIHTSQAQIDALVAKMIADAAPIELFTIIRVAEAGPEISDETVRNLMTVGDRV